MGFASDGGDLASRHDDGDGDDGDDGDQKSNFWWGLLLMEGISQADRATPQAQRTDPAPVHWDRKMMRLIMMMMMTSS